MRNATSVSQSAAGAPYGADWETQRKRVTAILLIAPVAIMTLLFLAPLAYLVWLSFGGPSGPNINSYKQLAAPVYLNLAYYTLQLAFIVTIACAVIAYPLAYLLANRRLYGPMFLGLCFTSIHMMGVGAWMAAFYTRTYGWEPATIGLYSGLVSLGLAGPALFGAVWFNEYLRRRGHADVNLRVMAIGLTAASPIMIAAPSHCTGDSHWPRMTAAIAILSSGSALLNIVARTGPR